VTGKLIFSSLAVLLLTGCVGPPHPAAPSSQGDRLDRLEAHLKEFSTSLEAVNSRLSDLDTRTQALASELTRARRASPLAPLELTPPVVSEQGTPPPATTQDFEVERISLGMLTGPADWDGQPGDDGIIVYLYPLDRSGDTVKRAGDCTFELFDLRHSERPLVMTWHIAAGEAAGLWETFPGCYRFKLAWQGSGAPPPEPVLKATFITLSGREFSETKQLRVKLPPLAEQPK
jgi:outer membrane murein-binding lipoprotein Lpp